MDLRLDRETCRLAWGLRRLGIGRGDVVGMYLPNLPHAAAAMLAVAKIGAIVLPMFSGFGADAVAERLSDGRAKALITSTARCATASRSAPRPSPRKRWRTAPACATWWCCATWQRPTSGRKGVITGGTSSRRTHPTTSRRWRPRPCRPTICSC